MLTRIPKHGIHNVIPWMTSVGSMDPCSLCVLDDNSYVKYCKMCMNFQSFWRSLSISCTHNQQRACSVEVSWKYVKWNRHTEAQGVGKQFFNLLQRIQQTWLREAVRTSFKLNVYKGLCCQNTLFIHTNHTDHEYFVVNELVSWYSSKKSSRIRLWLEYAPKNAWQGSWMDCMDDANIKN